MSNINFDQLQREIEEAERYLREKVIQNRNNGKINIIIFLSYLLSF